VEKVGIDENMDTRAAQLPEAVKLFFEFHAEVIKDGALSARMKKLIMVGISVALRCEHCITKNVSEAVRLGATREEILEAVSTAIVMAGGPAVGSSAIVLDTLEKLKV
jgi:AhpD family alkylhydroperoxidase